MTCAWWLILLAYYEMRSEMIPAGSLSYTKYARLVHPLTLSEQYER